MLHDAFLENINWDNFAEVCAPKADATKNLDILSRSLCPELDHFVCFSSTSCGKGNAGQMNYGYANSVMERICEERLAAGFPGKSHLDFAYKRGGGFPFMVTIKFGFIPCRPSHPVGRPRRGWNCAQTHGGRCQYCWKWQPTCPILP